MKYFYLLNHELSMAIKNQTFKQEEVLEDINWLIGIAEKEQIQKWLTCGSLVTARRAGNKMHAENTYTN